LLKTAAILHRNKKKQKLNIMKKLSLFVLVIAMSTSSFAEINKMGITTEKKITADEIVTSIKIYNNVEVVLTNNELNEIQIVGDNKEVENISVYIKNGELTITSSTDDFIKDKVVVFVPSKALASISIHGSSIVSSTEILSNEIMDITINGEGKSNIKTAGKVNVNTIGDFPLESSSK
jgi:Putative auto-transporter adhesin, head GIN domain